jgi:PAS domain S-box-containing protein
LNDRGTILVVDDEPESLRVLAGILQQEGYTVRPANSGELALASIAAQPPDLILLDIRMPGLDGFEVCRRLKAEEAARNIPVIFQSAATDLADRLEGLRLGAVDYISKPFQREELLARVRTHLELALLRGDLEELVKERTAQLELEIAERKRAEEHLKDNEARYRALFEGIPDALLIADIATGVIREVNPGACLLFARTRDELVGVHQSTLHPQRLARETEQSFLEDSHEAAEGKPGAPFEHVILRADGSEIPIEIRTQPVLLDGAKMILGVFRDISERKRAEEALRILNTELEERVKERTAELAAKNADLEKMNKLFVGRELRMVELKERIRELEERLGEQLP